MAVKNPIFRNFSSGNQLHSRKAHGSGQMSLPGSLRDTIVLLILFAISANFSWNEARLLQNRSGFNTSLLALTFALCALSAIALIWATVYRKYWAPVTGPLYSLIQGIAVGVVSSGVDRRYPGIAIHAVQLTVIMCLCLLFAYRFGIIRVTESFNKKLAVATSGVIAYYLVTLSLAFVNRHALYKISGGVPGILVSVVIVIIAGMSLISNFDFVVQASKENLPKYMEWYAALGLLVTLIWLYIEIMDLMSKAEKAEGR